MLCLCELNISRNIVDGDINIDLTNSALGAWDDSQKHPKWNPSHISSSVPQFLSSSISRQTSVLLSEILWQTSREILVPHRAMSTQISEIGAEKKMETSKLS